MKSPLRVYLAEIPPQISRRYPYIVVTSGGYMSIPMVLEKAKPFAAASDGTIIRISTGRPVKATS